MSYVYKLTNDITGEFYYGYRNNHKVPPAEDLGKIYFTSSKLVKPRFNEFTSFIVAEFNNKEEAFDLEQKLIHENWGNPFLLNRSCHYGKARFINTTPLTASAREKISKTHKGRKISEETKLKISSYHKGKTLSYQTKEKLRLGRLNTKMSEETKLKISLKLKGKK